MLAEKVKGMTDKRQEPVSPHEDEAKPRMKQGHGGDDDPARPRREARRLPGGNQPTPGPAESATRTEARGMTERRRQSRRSMIIRGLGQTAAAGCDPVRTGRTKDPAATTTTRTTRARIPTVMRRAAAEV